MVIRDLDVVRVARAPFEADPPLAIDADTVLPGPVPRKTFEVVAWRHAQRLDPARRVNLQELPVRLTLNLNRQPLRTLPIEHALSVGATTLLGCQT